MNRKMNKIYEKLSAYIDNELSPIEKKEIEKQIASSNLLQDKLAELLKIKSLTQSSHEPIESSNYFEAKLMQRLKKKKEKQNKIRLYIPTYGFILLALIFLLLKFEPDIFKNDIQNQNKSNIYTSNLIPLFLTANLSNEDVFNFAFYKKLPIDKSKNKFLELGEDEAGKEYFKIKHDNVFKKENNIEKFAFALGLNDQQKVEIDSIIKIYSEKLVEQILINDKNTLAVNQNLFNINRALTADLISYAAKTNKHKLKKIMPEVYRFASNKSIPALIKRIKKLKKSPNFVFFSDDTMFSKPYKINKRKIKQEIIIYNEKGRGPKIFRKYTVKINYDSIDVDIEKRIVDKVFFISDSNSFNVRVPPIPTITFKNFSTDSLIIELNKARKNFREFSYSFPKKFPKFKWNVKINYSDSTKDFDFEFKKMNLDSIIKINLELLDSLKTKNKYYFNFNTDSLNNIIKKLPKIYRKFEFKDRDSELEKIKREMKELKKELREMKKKFKMNKIKRKTSSTIKT